MSDPFAEVCVGCKKRCKMSSMKHLRGCVYEDSSYPKTADIWLNGSLAEDPKNVEKWQRIIQKMYPEAWAKENAGIEQ